MHTQPWLALLAASLLAACATPEQRAAEMQRQVDEMITVYGPACERLGYSRDAQGWRDCILRLDAHETRYRTTPSTTTCFGHRGFFQCSTF